MTETFKRKAITLAFAPALALSSAALYAGGEQRDQQKQQSSMTDPVEKQTFSALDRDNDGSVSMMEAAADPDAKQQFEELDKNNDYKLSRSEYEALERVSKETIGSGGAAAGGTSQSGMMEPKQSFTELDRDSDGSLSRSEYQHLEMTQGEQDKTWVEKSKQTYEERTK